MYDGVPVAWQIVPHIVNHLIISVVSSAECFACFYIFDRSLLSFDTAPRIAVSGVKSSLLAIAPETNRVRVERMEPS